MLVATLVRTLAVLALGTEFNRQTRGLQAFDFPLNDPQCTVIVFFHLQGEEDESELEDIGKLEILYQGCRDVASQTV